MSNTVNWHILVVEDEPDGREVVKSILDYFNIGADTVGTAEDALDRLYHSHYNAVVIDLALPGMDGMELLGEIRSSAGISNLPCIAITAFHTSSVRMQALKAGFDAYFPKPLNNTAFVQELDRIISRN